MCSDAFGSVSGVAPSYIEDMLTSVADMPGRGRLRSAASGSFVVPRVRTRVSALKHSLSLDLKRGTVHPWK